MLTFLSDRLSAGNPSLERRRTVAVVLYGVCSFVDQSGHAVSVSFRGRLRRQLSPRFRDGMRLRRVCVAQDCLFVSAAAPLENERGVQWSTIHILAVKQVADRIDRQAAFLRNKPIGHTGHGCV